MIPSNAFNYWKSRGQSPSATAETAGCLRLIWLASFCALPQTGR